HRSNFRLLPDLAWQRTQAIFHLQQSEILPHSICPALHRSVRNMLPHRRHCCMQREVPYLTPTQKRCISPFSSNQSPISYYDLPINVLSYHHPKSYPIDIDVSPFNSYLRRKGASTIEKAFS